MYTPNSSSVATNAASLSDRRPAARTSAWTLVSTHTDEARRTWLARRPVTA